MLSKEIMKGCITSAGAVIYGCTFFGSRTMNQNFALTQTFTALLAFYNASFNHNLKAGYSNIGAAFLIAAGSSLLENITGLSSSLAFLISAGLLALFAVKLASLSSQHQQATIIAR